MNFCFISREYTGSFRTGGIRTYLESIVPELVSAGHAVTVICADDAPRSSSMGKFGEKVVRVPLFDYWKATTFTGKCYSAIRGLVFYDLYRLMLLKAFLKENNNTAFDWVEFPDYGAEGKYILRFAKKASIKLAVVRTHGASFMVSEDGKVARGLFCGSRIRDEKRCIEFSDTVSCPSEFMKKIVMSEVFSIPMSKVRVIHNPIKSSTLGARVEFVKPSSDQFVLLYAGTLSEIKGVKLLIDAVIEIRRKGLNVILRLAGRITADIEKYLRNVDFCAGIQYLGVLDPEKMLGFYASGSMVIIPSYREPFGLVVLEAMRINGLVLASESGALPELITPGKNGFLFEAGSVDSIVLRIHQIMSMNESEIARVRKQAFESVCRYSPDVYVLELESVISQELRQLGRRL